MLEDHIKGRTQAYIPENDSGEPFMLAPILVLEFLTELASEIECYDWLVPGPHLLFRDLPQPPRLMSVDSEND
ncbi:MAG: hypothetical protein EHM61_24075 [Acidobacteria bacterium]|nr:MAG: hypothetical protein EHM61_24075 [Acidobacteriota bacterium]